MVLIPFVDIYQHIFMIHQQYILEVLKEFNLNTDQFHCIPLNAGLINDTYLVTDEKKEQFILQKINQNVFKNAGMLMNNIGYALPYLKANDYAQITFLHNRNNENFVHKHGGFWRMMNYIPHSTTYNTTLKKTIAKEAGRIVGTFHNLLEKTDTELFKDTLPKFHDLSHRKQEFKLALKNADSKKTLFAADALKKVDKFLTELEHLHTDQLPLRICHNDTKLNNILYSKNTDKALCLIDLDTIMKGYFFYDFGDAIRTVVNTAPEDEKDHTQIRFNTTLFEAFVDGLALNPKFLTEAEKESLPLGAVFMPFMHGLRALTDYLNNNTYYKVSYENQNLDRCLSLFDFAEKALNKKDFMAAYIQKRFM